MKMNWISIEEKLPPEGERVIVSITDETGDTSYDYTSVGWYSGQGYKFVVDNEYNNWVTHWMPRPKPFKKTDDNWLVDNIKEIISENEKLRSALADCRTSLCIKCGNWAPTTDFDTKLVSVSCSNCTWNITNMLKLLFSDIRIKHLKERAEDEIRKAILDKE